MSVFNTIQVGMLKSEIETLERKNFALSDKLADLNGKTVSFELTDAVAEMMGLVAA